MLKRALCGAVLSIFIASSTALPGAAQQVPPGGGGGAQGLGGGFGQRPGPAAYDTFVKGADVQDGLIAIIRKNGNTYLSLSKAQLGTDFIETSVPATGMGGSGRSVAPGEPYVAPARVFQFDRVDDTVVLRWPNTIAHVNANSPASVGVAENLPNSIAAVTPVVAQDDDHVVISAAPFLGDLGDLALHFLGGGGRGGRAGIPAAAGGGYRLDPQKSFFSYTKAFPDNDLLRVDQTFTSATPEFVDNAPDSRNVEMQMAYNIIAAPHDGYMPRMGDPRIGFFTQELLDFTSDTYATRNLYYITRWNFAPEHPGRPSNATRPLTFYIASDIPTEYRASIRDALLQWNKAFNKIGILNAVHVEQQPNDPNWSPDDIRHNMIRWITTSTPQYGAEALLVDDPRTGEEINVGVNIDATEGVGGRRAFRFQIAPARGIPYSHAAEEAAVQEDIYQVVLHESGHGLGLQHNFIGTMAYTMAQMQSKAFTQKYGVANSVMEYSPLNLFPKGMGQGDYWQTVLGPYDYYAIHWGYAPIPGASSPRAELSTLNKWAAGWSNPWTRFAGDEDSNFTGGHAIDPRVVTFDLTNTPLQWCGVQMRMDRDLMNGVNARFPSKGEPFDIARQAFAAPLGGYLRCAGMAAHWIGGEYLSRAAKGDPGAVQPLTPVSRKDSLAAWQQLETYLFNDSAWRFNPDVLTKLTYSEFGSLSGGGQWGYTPAPRHDVAVVEQVNATQNAVLNELFTPLRLQRLDDLDLKYGHGTTVSLTDLFDWTREGILGDLNSSSIAKTGAIHRNLQVEFVKRLAAMWTAPFPGTPPAAQALARHQLDYVVSEATAGAARSGLDEATRAHLEALAAYAKQALDTRMGGGGGISITLGEPDPTQHR